MKSKTLLLLLLPLMVIYLAACAAGGSFLAQNNTNVELAQPNFKIVAKDLEGKSSAQYIIGFSYSTGFLANTFALARVGGTATLYDDAVKDIWNKYKEQHGDIGDKKLALTNIRYDSDILNLFVYTQTELYLHADVVEFVE